MGVAGFTARLPYFRSVTVTWFAGDFLGTVGRLTVAGFNYK